MEVHPVVILAIMGFLVILVAVLWMSAPPPE